MFLKAKKAPQPPKIKENFGRQREITLKKLRETFSNIFLGEKRNFRGGKINHQ
jgi:hypothetical protein